MNERLTDEDIETRATMLANARRHGMSEQTLLVLAEELLAELRASRAPGSDPGAAKETSMPRPTYHCTACNKDHGGALAPDALPCKEYASLPGHPLGECEFSTGAYYPTAAASVKTPAPRIWTRAGSMSMRCGACGAEGVYQIKDGETWISWDPVTP